MRSRILPAALALFTITSLFCGLSRVVHGVALNWLDCALPWAAVVTLPWVVAWAWARRGWLPLAGRSPRPPPICWSCPSPMAGGCGWPGPRSNRVSRRRLAALQAAWGLHQAQG